MVGHVGGSDRVSCSARSLTRSASRAPGRIVGRGRSFSRLRHRDLSARPRTSFLDRRARTLGIRMVVLEEVQDPSRAIGRPDRKVVMGVGVERATSTDGHEPRITTAGIPRNLGHVPSVLPNDLCV